MHTPWTYEIVPARDSGRTIIISADNAVPLLTIPCWTDDPIDHEAIADLIVAAVNNHQRLVEENRVMREALERSKRYIVQLAHTANTLAEKQELGKKVKTEDFYEHIDKALTLADKG